MKIVTCVTTRYLPNMRHISRLTEAHEVIVLDEGPIPDRNKNSFVNRNLVWDDSLQKYFWLTVPVLRSRGIAIKDAIINPTDYRWPAKHIGIIKNSYGNWRMIAPDFMRGLEEVLECRREKLIDLNFRALKLIFDYCQIEAPCIRKSSDLVSSHSEQNRITMAKKSGATHYIAGEVEWSIMSSSGELAAFQEERIIVLRSPSLDYGMFDRDDCIKISVIGSILKYGSAKTRADIFKIRDFCRSNFL